jgi:multiple sugar transport system permease protein/raffinose/stachyose/melibiose transport system permease protein
MRPARLWLHHVRRTPLLLFVIAYTAATGGPFLWVASMSLRTTAEIFKNPYAPPTTPHWGKFADAWVRSSYGTYFWNSLTVVVGAAALLTVAGAKAAHFLARYRFRGSHAARFLILSGMILPPQLLILSLFQIMLDLGLYNSLLGLVLVYVATQLAMTVYILEGFFAQIPQDLFDAARLDGYGELGIFFRITLPVGLPALFTTVVLNVIILWNELAVSTRSARGVGVRLGRASRCRQVLLEDLARGLVAEAAARGVVEPVGEPAQVGSRERFGRALARQEAAGAAVQVLDATLLPGGVRVAEVGLHREVAVEGGVAGELAAAVEGDGPAGLLGQLPEGVGDAGDDRRRALVVVGQQDGEAALPLHQRGHVRLAVLLAEDQQVALPVPEALPAPDLRRAVLDPALARDRGGARPATVT